MYTYIYVCAFVGMNMPNTTGGTP